MILSINTGKEFDKIQHPFKITTHSTLGIEENILNLIKNIIKTVTANIKIDGEKIETFSQ
jgi:hypothetical protein